MPHLIIKAVITIILIRCTFWCHGVQGNDSIEELLSLSLEELADYEVVAPTKLGIPLSDTPGSVSVITYDRIRRSSARTIPELLRLVPGVHVRWNPMVQTIDIRSFGSNPFTSKVLLLIDGIPYNSWNKGGFPQHPGFDFFNIENIKHIEVIKGPGSALYGENAFNGVINIVTLSGREFRQTRAMVYAGDRNTRSAGITHGTTFGEDASVFVSARATQSQLPSSLWFELADADALGYDFFVKGEYKGLQFSYYRRQDDFDGYNLEDFAGPPGTVFRSADQIKQTVNIAALSYNKVATDKSWSFQSNVSYADRDGSHCAACHAPSQHPDFEKQSDHGYQLFANAQMSFNPSARHQLLFGAELRRLETGDHDKEFIGAPQIGATPPPPGNTQQEVVTAYNKGAIFVQDQVSLLDKRLEITAGLRFDSDTSPDLFGSELSPRIALVAKPNDKLTLRAGWHKAARYPSFTELYQNTWFFSVDTDTTSIPFSIFEPNVELKPEKIESFEAGLEYRPFKNLQAKLDFFQNRIHNPIGIAYISRPDGTRIRFENHPNDATVSGAELELNMEFSPSMSAFFNWSYQRNKQNGSGVDSNGDPIEFTYSPRHKSNAGLTYTPNRNFSTTFEVSWRDQYEAPSFWYPITFNDDPRVRPLDSYVYANLRIQYRFPFNIAGSIEPLSLSIYGKNLLDERPYETLAGRGVRAPGFEMFIGLEYDWSF